MRQTQELFKSWKDGFQSTHPLRDATCAIVFKVSPIPHFNPRTPYGMRRLHQAFTRFVEGISIHAPLTGCDTFYCFQFQHLFLFQSTHPLRDATEYTKGR